MDWNLVSEIYGILQTIIFVRKKVKPTDLNSLDKSAIQIFVTLGRNENTDIQCQMSPIPSP